MDARPYDLAHVGATTKAKQDEAVDLHPARGVLLGVALSLALWGVVAVLLLVIR